MALSWQTEAIFESAQLGQAMLKFLIVAPVFILIIFENPDRPNFLCKNVPELCGFSSCPRRSSEQCHILRY